MRELLLTEEECMVELTELEDRAIGGEDIRWDKVSEVIKKAQLKKLIECDKFHLLEAPPFREVTTTFTSSIRWISESDWQALLEACK